MLRVQLMMVLCLVGASRTAEDLPRVLIISLDGFRYDYLKLAHARGIKTPTFDKMISEGVSIKDPGLTNAFITITFPNHYTLVTGLYEESHGIVANSFFDPVYNETFSYGPDELKWWNGTGSQSVIPVWVTNEVNGTERASGVYFWIGGNVIGQEPKYNTKIFNSSVPFLTRINTMVGWFNQSTKPINFGALYSDEPDKSGHRHGPDSIEVANKIGELDADIGVLIEGLKSAKLYEKMNIILTSDHGMEPIDSRKTIYLEDHVDLSTFRTFSGSPVMHLLPNDGFEDAVYHNLSTILNLLVHKKNDIPEKFHYTNSRRIMPIVIVAPLGGQICKTRLDCWISKGDHGWDNGLPSMHPIFIARGPAFKKNYVAKPFDTINIYALLCHLLDIPPQPNNGTVDNVKDILYVASGANTDDVGSIFLITTAAILVQLSW